MPADDELIRRAQSMDIRVALEAIRELHELADEWEDSAVKRARKDGLTWAEIASLLGRVKSSVWERHAGADHDD